MQRDYDEQLGHQLYAQLNDLRTEMHQRQVETQRQLDDSRRENQELRTEIHQLRTEPTPTPATMSTEQPVPPNRGTDSRPRPRYPDVDPYNGEDPRDYRVFRVNLRTKFVVDAPCFLSDEEQILYAFGRLRGKASQRILPWIIAKQNQLPTLSDFYQALDQAFDDPEVQRKALVRVNTMKQGKRDLEDFLAEFEGTLIDAGGLLWSDAQKKALLDTAVNRQLLQGTIGTDQPATYEEYCKQLRRINHQQARINRLTSRHTRAPHSPPRTRKPSGPDPMDWESTSAQVAALKNQIAALQRGEKGRGTGRAQATWASETEMTKRRTENRCLRCGSKKHLIRDCSMLPAQKPTGVAATRTVGESSDEEDEYEYSNQEQEEGSGKA